MFDLKENIHFNLESLGLVFVLFNFTITYQLENDLCPYLETR